MRKKSGFIPIAIGIEQAIVLVPEFEKIVRKLEQQVTLRGSEQKVKIPMNILPLKTNCFNFPLHKC